MKQLQKIVLNYGDVCSRIYAASALAAVASDAEAPFLHPDHEEALRMVVRDNIAALVASIPSHIIVEANYGELEATLLLDGRCRDLSTAQGAFLSAATVLTLAVVKLSAHADQNRLSSLVSVLPALAESLTRRLQPAPRPTHLHPYPPQAYLSTAHK